MLDIEALRKSKMRSFDRLLNIEVIDGTKPKSSTGIVDSRIFNGEANLHAVMLPTGLWTFKYDHGTLPEQLKKNFTSFGRLKEFADNYFKKRNLRISKVID